MYFTFVENVMSKKAPTIARVTPVQKRRRVDSTYKCKMCALP